MLRAQLADESSGAADNVLPPAERRGIRQEGAFVAPATFTIGSSRSGGTSASDTGGGAAANTDTASAAPSMDLYHRYNYLEHHHTQQPGGSWSIAIAPCAPGVIAVNTAGVPGASLRRCYQKRRVYRISAART